MGRYKKQKRTKVEMDGWNGWGPEKTWNYSIEDEQQFMEEMLIEDKGKGM